MVGYPHREERLGFSGDSWGRVRPTRDRKCGERRGLGCFHCYTLQFSQYAYFLPTGINFAENAKNHVPWVLPFLYFSEHFPEGILQLVVPLEFDIEIMRLRRALLTNQEVNLRQAKGLWRDGEYYKAKKSYVQSSS